MFSDNGSLNDMFFGKYVNHSCYFSWSSKTSGTFFVSIHVCNAGHLSKYKIDSFRSIKVINEADGKSFSLRVSKIFYKDKQDVMEFHTIMSIERLLMCRDSEYSYMVTCENDIMNEKNVFMELHL